MGTTIDVSIPVDSDAARALENSRAGLLQGVT